MTILVQSPGLLTTVQDLGRPGHGIDGVSRAGAADPLALRLGNLLLGNPANTPALETTLLGGTYVFPDGATIALTGATPFALAPYEIHTIAPGQTIQLGPLTNGARCYLCVQGGIDVPRIGGSASTHLLSGLGGGPILKGAVLQIAATTNEPKPTSIPEALKTNRKTVRVTRGPQADQFESRLFYQTEYQVTQDTNRMGIRLAGPPVPAFHDSQMRTEGVPLGAIQIPANGQPIILFVDQQTTGGYPKIANVITADLPSLGQLRPGDKVRFEQVSPVEARRLLLEQEAQIEAL
jgi:biotin-dependent carboxylase-like uncharacterized protein